jgi:hypothetical protein
MRADDAACAAAADDLYGSSPSAGVETLYDDRDERGGAKFATMDLIGLPWQLIVGPKGLAAGTSSSRTAHRRARGAQHRKRAGEADRMILSRYERMIAKRYLLPGKGEGFIFLVAIDQPVAVALGVAALIIVMSVMNGFRAELFDKIVGLNGHAVVQGYGGRLPDWQQIVEQARKTPGVTSAVPLIEQPLMASSNGRVEGVLVRGMRVRTSAPTRRSAARCLRQPRRGAAARQRQCVAIGPASRALGAFPSAARSA